MSTQEAVYNRYTDADPRAYAFEFEANIIAATSMSWDRKLKDANGNPTGETRKAYINKYAFASPTMNGNLIEWLDEPTEPVIRRGPCKLRFRQLRPSREMFGFYELSGYPVINKK